MKNTKYIKGLYCAFSSFIIKNYLSLGSICKLYWVTASTVSMPLPLPSPNKSFLNLNLISSFFKLLNVTNYLLVSIKYTFIIY